jgi:hypothetical protein
MPIAIPRLCDTFHLDHAKRGDYEMESLTHSRRVGDSSAWPHWKALDQSTN